MIIVDADEGSDICSSLRVKGFPTLVTFINKEMVETRLVKTFLCCKRVLS